MATAKRKPLKTSKDQPKQPIAEVRKENERLKILFETGIRCSMCGALKPAEKFYVDTNPYLKTGRGHVCKECIGHVALRQDKDGFDHEPTKDSVRLACRILDKPFLEALWDASVEETRDDGKTKFKSNVWAAYIKNVQMTNYVGLTYLDSDGIKPEKVKYADEMTADDVVSAHEGQDTYDSFDKNKKDVIRLLEYDPFEKESVVDQPFLYSQLLGLLDTNGAEVNEDMIRTSSAISIARGFLQASKIDDALARMMNDITALEENAATIKSLQDSKKNIMTQIKDLAAESCLSLKNSKNSVKGENTWTGKVKKIKDLNLRGAEVNGFDIATCRGMQQVQEISDASIMKQLSLDESEWSDMVANMRVTNKELRAERDQYKEINRILLQENLDLKDFLEDNNMIPEKAMVNLRDIYSVFAGQGEEEGDIDEQDTSSE